MPPPQLSLLYSHSYKGAQVLAEDVKFYGEWMQEEAFKKIGKYYPQVDISMPYLRNSN